MANLYADIIIDISHEKVDKSFQYLVPERLRTVLEVGMCVRVPFGNGNKERKGYVIGLGDRCNYDPKRMKEIRGIEQSEAGVEDRLIQLAGWIRKNYGSTMIQALKTVIPAKQTVKKLEHRTIVRKMTKEELLSVLGESRRKKQVAKERLLKELLEQPGLPYEWVTGKLGVSPQTINGLVKLGAIQIESSREFRNPVHFQTVQEIRKNILSEEQQKIVNTVVGDYDNHTPGTYLIHGITGSGKTEVYMSIIEQMVMRGKQAIVLIPEIALTYQTLLRFYRRFGNRVSVMNSTLSPGEKYDQCERAKKGEIDVIIGPRSALFTPFPNVGVIVMDEEHEGSYKSESTPKYHARETAQEVARLHKAAFVMGSATPSLESYYRAQMGEYQIFTLNRRLTGGSLPRVHTIDLRQELREGNRSIFSRKLQELMEDRLQKGEQTILFLNRRGYAGFISCRACGLVMKCPHCDVSLSEHKNGMLVCHYCGYSEPKKTVCPKCGSKYVSGFKAGTQQIEDKLIEMFPGARVLRMDADTTRTKESYERILSAFANREADILIGTQMIVKGHDFPAVTLVGVLAADLSLGVNNYRAGERTFQLLTQAVGRAGRGTLPGEAVIQTYQPEHYAVTFAAKQDYSGFYEEEILYRELGGYPPVEHMLAVQVFAKDEWNGKKLAEELAAVAKANQNEPEQAKAKQNEPEQAKAKQNESEQAEAKQNESGQAEAKRDGVVNTWSGKNLRIIGPVAATISKINDIFRFVFYIKASEYDKLIKIKDILEMEIQRRLLRNELVQFDFDPMNTM